MVVFVAMLVLGTLWVIVTDELLYRLVDDPSTTARFETAKGWIFVALVATGAYATTAYTFSELTRSEGTLSAVFESIADGVLLLGSDRTIVDANPAAVRILGVSCRDDLVGMGAREFASAFRLTTADGRLLEPTRYSSQRAFDGEVIPPYVAMVHPRSGPPTTIQVTVAPVKSRRDGSVQLVVSVMRDVTEEKKLEELRDRFFAAAAHALKTPLAAVKAHAQLLLRAKEPTDAVRRGATAIDRQCARLDGLMQNLLALARMRNETLSLDMRDLALEPLVAKVVTEQASRFAGILRFEASGAHWVFGDRERLALVIRNLVEAAVRFAPKDTTVLLELSEREERVRVSVNAPVGHNGEGYTFKDETALALHVSQELVRAHAGTTALEPVLGARLAWFELPAMGARRGADPNER